MSQIETIIAATDLSDRLWTPPDGPRSSPMIKAPGSSCFT